MTLLDNPKRQKVLIKNMQRDINVIKKMYKDKPIMNTLTEEQKEKSWQNVFNQNKIIEQLAVFENNNEYMSTNAVFLAIMMQYTYKYLKWITVLPNIDWYFYKDERNTQNNDMIQCIVSNCPHKNNPICFMSWVPSNKPHIIHKYTKVMNKEYYADRAYIMAVCDIHYNKWRKDESKVMDFMLDYILPLRKYEDKNGFVNLPPIPEMAPMPNKEQLKQAFDKIGISANEAQKKVTELVDNIKENNLDENNNNKE